MYQVHQIIQYNEIQNSFPLLFLFTVSSLDVIYVLKKFISSQVDPKWRFRGHSTGFGPPVINFTILFFFCALPFICKNLVSPCYLFFVTADLKGLSFVAASFFLNNKWIRAHSAILWPLILIENQASFIHFHAFY